jgi:hypothetical protein
MILRALFPLCLLAIGLTSGCVGSVSPGPTAGADPTAGRGGPRSPGMMAAVGGTGGAGGTVGTGGTPGAGGGGGSPPGSPPAQPEAFSCDPQAKAPPNSGWRRLGAGQYRNTLRDLLAFGLGDGGAAAAVMASASAELGRWPADERQKLPQDLHGSYRRLDQDVEQLHVEVSYEVARVVAANVTPPARLATLAGACAIDANPANDGDCLDGFIRRFGQRALRRPLLPDEVTFYRGLYGGTPGADPAGYADVIMALLTAPEFLYHVEHGETPVAGRAGRFGLTAHELASRLSYHFWDTMPDDELWAAAGSGALATAEGYRMQVDRLFRDPRTRPTLDGFFRDWLKLDDVASLDGRNGNPVFKAFAGPDLPRPSLRAEMIDEVMDLTRHFVWDRPDGFEALLTTELNFARGTDLARLYATQAWDGKSTPAAFPAGQRPGLFTRAAFLATGSPTTRPVMKGVFLRHNVLCDDIPPPPDNAMANLPELDPRLSTRQVVEAITEAPGSACAACHARFINPVGFATENFDALGRLRTSQPLFDDKGMEIARVPVDTRTVPQIVGGDLTPSAGAADLMRLVVDSGKAQACFARHYFRFSFGRWEDLASDGCVLERLRGVLVRKAPLAEVLREVALAPEFQQRTLTDGGGP